MPIRAHPADPARSGRTVAPVRATSPPIALTVAAAAVPLLAAVLMLLAVPSTAVAARWLRPVPGEVARTFDYSRAAPFARGAHRGADLAAPAGTPVRTACGGQVLHAGAVAGRRIVSVRCGRLRVSYLPLASLAVRAGADLRAGAPIGTVAAGHGGLHVGVRREGDPFGYEDPLSLIAPRAPARPPATPPAVRARPRAAPPPAPARPYPLPTMPRLAPMPSGRDARPATPARRVAPWPVWAGLALLLCGAAGSGTIAARRRRSRTRTRVALAPATRPRAAPPHR